MQTNGMRLFPMNEEQAYFLHIKWGDSRVYISIGYWINQFLIGGGSIHCLEFQEKKNGSPLNVTLT